MSSLTLKNLPEDLLDALRKAASRDRRSLTQQIFHLLDVALRGQDERPRAAKDAHVQAQVAAWRKLAGKWESDVDRRTEARRIAQRRTRGREVDL